MLNIKIEEKKYGGKIALKNVDLSINRGEIVGLFGENGAGKTTLIKCILNLLKYKGEVSLDGEKISRSNIEKLSFATCEHSFFENLTPRDHLVFYREHFPNFNEKRYSSLMEFFGLSGGKILKGMSTGQKNQFELILALSQGADYIFMDEPFAGNDIFNREDFYKLLLAILEPKETILLSTHLIAEVENFVSRGIFLRKGEIIGDFDTLELQENGKTLMSAIKESFGYENDRVSRAIDQLRGEEN